MAVDFLSLFFGAAQMVSQAKADVASAEQSESVQRFNIAQTRRKAKSLLKVGAEAEFELRSDLRRQLARNRVRTAAAGVDVSTGTPLESELLVVRDFAADITTLSEVVRGQVQDLETQAQFQERQAEAFKKAAKKAKKSPGGILGKTTILGKIF